MEEGQWKTVKGHDRLHPIGHTPLWPMGEQDTALGQGVNEDS